MINIFDALHIKSTIQKQEPKTTLYLKLLLTNKLDHINLHSHKISNCAMS